MAPPISKGILIFSLLSSFARKTISSRDGVIRPDKPITSTFSSTAVLIIFSGGTITPKSIISKLLQAKTTPTIFFPMSCTSPFTVAIKIFPAELLEPSVFASSINGNKYATAFFITLADFTTCGRNIFPSPNKSPTIFIPVIKCPSITLIGVGTLNLASSTSW